MLIFVIVGLICALAIQKRENDKFKMALSQACMDEIHIRIHQMQVLEQLQTVVPPTTKHTIDIELNKLENENLEIRTRVGELIGTKE